MALTSTLKVFEIDDTDDRERSSDNVSRYGIYVADRRDAFAGHWNDGVETDPVRFTSTAWRIACGPVMSPAYLGWTADRIHSVKCDRNNWDGALLVSVKLAAPRPVQLRSLYRFGDWTDDGTTAHRGYYQPYEEELGRRPHLFTTCELTLPVPTDALHTPVDAPERLTTRDAKASVRALATFLDGPLAEVLEAMDR